MFTEKLTFRSSTDLKQVIFHFEELEKSQVLNLLSDF